MRKLSYLLLLLLFAGRAYAGTCPTGANYLNLTTAAPTDSLVTLASLGITNCYYIAANGNDSNSGTSESSPWLHAPGMYSTCSGNCATVQTAVYSNGSGYGFIFRGGDTWHEGNSSASPYTGGSWLINNGPISQTIHGSSGSPVYFGVDTAWYNSGVCGSSWCRPILNADNPPSTSQTLSSCTYPGGTDIDMINVGAGSYTILDNFEMLGLCHAGLGQNYANGGNAYIMENGLRGPMYYRNLYMHGWTHVAYAPGYTLTPSSSNCPSTGVCFGTLMIYGLYSSPGAEHISHIVADGSDSDFEGAGFCYCGLYDVAYSYIGNTMEIINTNLHIFHDNLYEYFYENGHGDMLYGFGGEGGTVNVMYNNVFRHLELPPAGSNSAGIQFYSAGGTDYFFNNVMYDIPQSMNAELGSYCGATPGTCNAGTLNIFNNTIQTQTGDTPIHCQPVGSTSTTNVANNHVITQASSIVNSACGSGGNAITQTTNLLMNNAAATSKGYTASQSFAYSPTASNSPTVGTGTNEQSNCSALLSAASGDPTLVGAATACQNDTTYACSYNTSNHTMNCPARTSVSRPTSAAWNIGDYQYNGGPSISFATSPLAFGNVNLGANSSLPDQITNSGNANLVLGTPYYTITGTNAADFTISSSTCSNGGTVTPSSSCTPTVKFIPSVAGAESAVLTINGNAVGTVTLTGNGVAVSASMMINPGPGTGAFVQAFYCSGNANVTSLSGAACTFASAMNLNDSILCSIGWFGGAGSISSITDTAGNSYGSAILTQTLSGFGTVKGYLASPIAAAVAGNGLTVNWTGGTVSYPSAKCAEYTGPTPVDVTSLAATGTGTAESAGPISTAFSNDLLVMVTTSANNLTAVGSGYTPRLSIATVGDTLADQLVSSVGNYSATGTQAPSGQWIMELFALQAPQSLIFPPQSDGVTSAALTETVTNTGSTTITLGSAPHWFSFTGTNAADFAGAAGGTCSDGGTILAGASCTGKFTITPSAPGTRSATLNVLGTVTQSIPVSGTGVGAAQCGTPTFSPVAGVVNSGTTVTFGSGCDSGTYCSTIDGSTPTANGAGTCTHGATGGTVTVSALETVKAISSKSGNTDSLVGSAAYTLTLVTLGNPGFSP